MVNLPHILTDWGSEPRLILTFIGAQQRPCEQAWHKVHALDGMAFQSVAKSGTFGLAFARLAPQSPHEPLPTVPPASPSPPANIHIHPVAPLFVHVHFQPPVRTTQPFSLHIIPVSSRPASCQRCTHISSGSAFRRRAEVTSGRVPLRSRTSAIRSRLSSVQTCPLLSHASRMTPPLAVLLFRHATSISSLATAVLGGTLPSSAGRVCLSREPAAAMVAPVVPLACRAVLQSIARRQSPWNFRESHLFNIPRWSFVTLTAIHRRFKPLPLLFRSPLAI